MQKGGTLIALALVVAAGGCSQWIIDSSDRQVYDLVYERQQDTLGETHDMHIGKENGQLPASASLYSESPHPVDSSLRSVDFDQLDRGPAGEGDPVAASDPYQNPLSGDAEAGALNDGSTEPAGTTHPEATEQQQDEDGLESVRPNLLPAENQDNEPQTAAVQDQPPATGDQSTGEEAGQNEPAVNPQEPSMANLTPEEAWVLGYGIPVDAPVFSLSDALSYAMRHSRDLQSAKEDLYLDALDLTLERHLWTPQFVASVQSEYANYGQIRDFDHAMSLTSQVSLSQRLPYGGDVTARVINTLMRDLGAHVTSGEPGSMILSANIPLLRGAGRVARESRYQAERNLIYGVRTYERFRRSLLVDLASDYFSLQQSKASIANARASYMSSRFDLKRAEAFRQLEQDSTIFDLTRARSFFRQSEASLVSAQEQYASALDRFKIRIGMPVDEPLDVVPQEEDEESAALEELLPPLDEIQAVNLGTAYRLDLLNSLDRVEDRQRAVLIAKNAILPDLDLAGSVTMNTDPEHLSSTSYNTERVTWRSTIELSIDDRKSERNSYRAALINFRRAERQHEESVDSVRSDVRRALRRIEQQDRSRQIQELNVEENEVREAAAGAQYEFGRIGITDKVDAQNDLLRARNDYAAAIAAYRQAVLEFLRDTGTLRVDEEGLWAIPDGLRALGAGPSGNEPAGP
jgi:outer membrane protein TolC